MSEDEAAYREALGALASSYGLALPSERVPAIAALLPGLQGRLRQAAALLSQDAPPAVIFDADPQGAAP